MEVRLAKLYNNGYIDWPDNKQRRTKPIPEPMCWLGWKGILLVASKRGAHIDPPSSDNENQLRKLEKQLRDQGVLWLREPRWIQLEHDLGVGGRARAVADYIAGMTDRFAIV